MEMETNEINKTSKALNEITTKQVHQRNVQIRKATLPPRPDAPATTRPILIPPPPPPIGTDSSDNDLYNDVPKGINNK